MSGPVFFLIRDSELFVKASLSFLYTTPLAMGLEKSTDVGNSSLYLPLQLRSPRRKAFDEKTVVSTP